MAKFFDVLIIGGGAAGITCANIIKMQDENISVAVLEQMPRVLKKLLVTGNGRCNISNKKIEPSRYHGENSGFCKYALTTYGNFVSEVFFNQLGIVFTYDKEGKAYPYSLQASSVVDALRFKAEETGVQIFTENKVTDIEKSGNAYKIITENGAYKTENLVIAAGALSGGDSVGSNGSVLKILEKMGYKTVKTTPALVQIKTENAVTKSLKGIKVEAAASLLIDERLERTEKGEVLFCDYGLSGPPVMQISRAVERSGGNIEILLDLMPDYSFDSVYDMIRYRRQIFKSRSMEEFFTGLLNKRVGQAIVKLSGIKLSEKAETLTPDNIKSLTENIKKMQFKVTGTTGFINSQVTAGGLDTSAFDDETMMSEKDEGLYCIGEILDIDGDCGGFNLQWAWSSAMCAADAICDKLIKDDNN